MAADLVGGPLGHALEDLAAAYYLGRSVASPIVGGVSQAAGKGARAAATSAGQMYSRPFPMRRCRVLSPMQQHRPERANAGQSTKVLNF